MCNLNLNYNLFYLNVRHTQWLDRLLLNMLEIYIRVDKKIITNHTNHNTYFQKMFIL